jgi:hypothetical protein
MIDVTKITDALFPVPVAFPDEELSGGRRLCGIGRSNGICLLATPSTFS